MANNKIVPREFKYTGDFIRSREIDGGLYLSLDKTIDGNLVSSSTFLYSHLGPLANHNRFIITLANNIEDEIMSSCPGVWKTENIHGE